MTKAVRVGDFSIGGGSALAVVAGPCVIESLNVCIEIAKKVKDICIDLGMPYVFKASFDKANRTSGSSYRGLGLDKGLEVLAEVKSKTGLPVLTDIHESWQAKPAAEVVDILQIPAFLCRQTDLIAAAAASGRPVNIKKGQFLSPWDMQNVVEKFESAGGRNLLLTERGVSFGYNMLVVDMCSLPVMRSFGYPVIFDATHSVQRPGGMGSASGGAREFIPHLVRAAAAVGIDALFMEVHPEPEKALSDAASMLPLSDLRSVLRSAKMIDETLRACSG